MQDLKTIYPKIKQLLSRAKELSHQFNLHMKEKPDFEQSFLKKNQNKPVVLITSQGEREGILKDMNRYRVEIEGSNGMEYHIKNTLLGFYAKS